MIKNFHPTWLLCVTAVAAMTAGCGPKNDAGTSTATPTSGSTSAAAAKTLEIAVIPKGTTHDYWKSVHAGANKAQEELAKAGTNVDIQWKGPLREDDRNGQIDVVQTFVTQQVNGIVLAPLDNQALVRPVTDAVSAKIPVVIIDSSLNGNDYASYVATNNEKGGELGGQELAKVLGNNKRVLMMRYSQGSASTDQRETGFLKAIKADPGVQLVSVDQYGGATVDSAYKTAQNLLVRFGTQIDGIFTPNETTTRGMLLALHDAGLLHKVKFVGFDSSPDLIAALQAKELDGLVVQDPFKMGYLAVKTVVDDIQGKPFPKTIDTGVTLVTPDNMNDPAIHALLNPPLDQYLK